MFKLLHRLPLQNQPCRIAWLPDASGLLLGTYQGIVLWRWNQEPQFWSGNIQKGIRALEMSPDGRSAWAGGLIHEPGLDAWNLETGAFTACVNPPTGTIYDLLLDSEKRRLYFCTNDGEIGWWNLASGLIERLPVSFDQYVTHLALDAAGKRLAWLETGVRGAMVYLWDLEQEKGLLNYPLKNDGRLLRFDGDTLIWGECGKNIQLYRLPLSVDKPLTKTKIPKIEVKLHKRPVMTLALSPDQRLAASASTYNEPKVIFWDTQTGQSVGEYSERVTPADLKFSPDGSMLAIAGKFDVQVIETV